jgi:hypothetical protein
VLNDTNSLSLVIQVFRFVHKNDIYGVKVEAIGFRLLQSLSLNVRKDAFDLLYGDWSANSSIEAQKRDKIKTQLTVFVNSARQFDQLFYLPSFVEDTVEVAPLVVRIAVNLAIGLLFDCLTVKTRDTTSVQYLLRNAFQLLTFCVRTN